MNVIIWLQIDNRGGVELLNPAINVLKRLYGNVNIIGAITPQGININGVKTINKQDLNDIDYDLILVSGRNASITSVIKEADIDIDKIVLDRTVCIPLFTLDKYRKLQHSKLSILSINCWGGLMYHQLGLPFLSPTINMFFSEVGFLNFIKDSLKNMEKPPHFKRTAIEPHIKTNYPVLSLGKDIELHMNHYPDKKVAITEWNKRVARVNPYNILVMAYTSKQEFLAEFDKIPYAKKVCYVPFETDLDSGFYVNPVKYSNLEFWQIVNQSAGGSVVNYDIWDMLLYGKKTVLIQQ